MVNQWITGASRSNLSKSFGSESSETGGEKYDGLRLVDCKCVDGCDILCKEAFWDQHSSTVRGHGKEPGIRDTSKIHLKKTEVPFKWRIDVYLWAS